MSFVPFMLFLFRLLESRSNLGLLSPLRTVAGAPDPQLGRTDRDDPARPQRYHEQRARWDSGRRERDIQHARDDPHRRDGDRQREDADHPLTVPRYMPGTNREIPFAHRSEEQPAEERDRQGLTPPSEWHEQSKVESGDHPDRRGDEQRATGPAMQHE